MKLPRTFISFGNSSQANISISASSLLIIGFEIFKLLKSRSVCSSFFLPFFIEARATRKDSSLSSWVDPLTLGAFLGDFEDPDGLVGGGSLSSATTSRLAGTLLFRARFFEGGSTERLREL